MQGHQDHKEITMTACAKAIGACAKASAPACSGASLRKALKKHRALCEFTVDIVTCINKSGPKSIFQNPA
jgi:hypothetical protein